MNLRFWKKKKSIKAEPTEATQALREAEHRHVEALYLAERLFKSRQANHYAERIRQAYELETR